MSLEKVIAISGKPGLFEIISRTKSGLIVQSMSDGKRFPVNSVHNVSTLSDIAIYTYEEEVPLPDVLINIHEKEAGESSIDPKSDKQTLLDYFGEVLPGYDEERVYPSNIKKVISWYNTLVQSGFDFDSLKNTEAEEASDAKEPASE
jgi:hypothetical protein